MLIALFVFEFVGSELMGHASTVCAPVIIMISFCQTVASFLVSCIAKRHPQRLATSHGLITEISVRIQPAFPHSVADLPSIGVTGDEHTVAKFPEKVAPCVQCIEFQHRVSRESYLLLDCRSTWPFHFLTNTISATLWPWVHWDVVGSCVRSAADLSVQRRRWRRRWLCLVRAELRYGRRQACRPWQDTSRLRRLTLVRSHGLPGTQFLGQIP